MSFTVNLVGAPNICGGASIALQTVRGGREQTLITYHMPFALPTNAQLTASAAGIPLSPSGACACGLRLVLLSPRCVIATCGVVTVLCL